MPARIAAPDSRWEYRRELRECRREIAQARRDGYRYRSGYRWRDAAIGTAIAGGAAGRPLTGRNAPAPLFRARLTSGPPLGRISRCVKGVWLSLINLARLAKDRGVAAVPDALDERLLRAGAGGAEHGRVGGRRRALDAQRHRPRSRRRFGRDRKPDPARHAAALARSAGPIPRRWRGALLILLSLAATFVLGRKRASSPGDGGRARRRRPRLRGPRTISPRRSAPGSPRARAAMASPRRKSSPGWSSSGSRSGSASG